MTCNCRILSLQVFVQSLSQLSVATTSLRTVHQATRSPAVAHPYHGFVRSFTAAAAAHYPRRARRSPISRSAESNHQFDSSPDTSRSTPSRIQASTIVDSVASISPQQLADARNDQAILDLSPEAVDALALELGQTNITSEVGHGGSRHEKRHAERRKPELFGSSRLKRSKILPPNIQKADEQTDSAPPKKDPWMTQKAALREKFPDGWQPRKRLSPDALDGIRALHSQYPKEFTTEVLAQKFEVSPEAIRRILRAKWRPSVEEEERRQERWFNRGKNIWSQMAELGAKPPKRWRQAGVVRDPSWNKKRGPRTEYPYVPRKQASKNDESTQRRLGEGLM